MGYYRHLSSKRARIDTPFTVVGFFSYAAIGKNLNRNKSFIYREIRRNTGKNGFYSSSETCDKYKKRRKNCHARYSLDNPELFKFVKDKIFNFQWFPK